jgi:putative transposase
MSEDRLPLNELLQKAGDGDFLRAVAESVLQLLMEADVEGLIGAGRHERAADRLNWRNGYRDRTLDTRLGSLNLEIPKLRAGSSFPPFLEARKTTEKALVAVIQEAWIGGVDTWRRSICSIREPYRGQKAGCCPETQGDDRRKRTSSTLI